MAASAPPVADTKKPAPQPPEKKGGKAGGDQAADKGVGQGAGKGAASVPADKPVTPQQRVDRMAVRAKMAVSEPGDAVEQEADQMASQVSRKLAEPDTGKAAAAPGRADGTKKPKEAAGPAIARTAASRVPSVMREANADQVASRDQQQQADLGGAAGKPDPTDTQARIKQQLGQGGPLPDGLKERLEGTFSHDFSNVRIHHDAQADVLAKDLDAHAFTVGSDIFFAAGQFQPGSPEGTQLLAHELTHVVQQKDSAPALNRRIDPSAPAARHKPGSGTPGALAAMETLDLPGVKRRHLPLYADLAAKGALKRKKGYDRQGADQRAVWSKMVKVAPDAVRERLMERGITPPANDKDKVAVSVGGKAQKKKVSELQSMLAIPTWGKNGKKPKNGFQVDHIIELQVSGQQGQGVGNSIENMELLDQPSNSSSGGQIRGGIYKKVDAYLATYRPAPDRGAFLKKHDLVFERVQASGGGGEGASSWWTRAEIEAAEPLKTAQPAPPTRDGKPDEFVLSSGAGGIEVGRFQHAAAETTITPKGAARRRLSGLEIESISLTDAGAGGGGNVGSIQAKWDLPKDWQPTDPKVTLALTADGDYRGYPASIPALGLDFKHLSPVMMDAISVEDGMLKAEGLLTPSLPIFKTPIKVALNGRDISFAMDFSAGDLALPIPGLTVDDSTVRLSYSTEDSFGVSGMILFSVEKVGSGSLTASFSATKGVGLEGRFNFDRSLFDRAEVSAWYREGRMGAEGVIGIDQPDKIRGIKSASLTVGVNNGDWSFLGTAALTLPGVSDATIGVTKNDNGLVFDGLVTLSSSALVKSGNIHVTAKDQADGWKLTATGTAQPNIPGVDSQLNVNYDDGAFTATFAGAYTKGMMAGQVTVGVTNRSVDEQGNIGALADPNAPLVVYGGGSATLKIAPWLQATAGIRFSPTGEVTVSGEIGLPGHIELFPRQEVDKTLFNLSTQIPIVPGVVAEVGGNLKASAGFGPGVLDQLRLGIEYNPAQEENTHITGDAHVKVPGDAGLRLAARAGIGLGITGASATGGIELGGALGIDGAAEAGVQVDWTPRTGLAIEAEAAFSAQPKFKFDVSGYVSVKALGFEVYDNRWELAAFEMGSDLQFGVRFPVKYKEGEAFNVSLDDVEFEVPDVDLGAMVGQLGDRIF
jgi:hypothetical protein